MNEKRQEMKALFSSQMIHALYRYEDCMHESPNACKHRSEMVRYRFLDKIKDYILECAIQFQPKEGIEAYYFMCNIYKADQITNEIFVDFKILFVDALRAFKKNKSQAYLIKLDNMNKNQKLNA